MNCQRFNGESQVYLCPSCIVWLRQRLLGLPTLLGFLHDAATGQTKMGEDGPVRTAMGSRVPMFNPRAGALAEQIGATVTDWATELARTHGLVFTPPVSWHRAPGEYRYTPADYAVFLAANVDRIAKNADCGALCATLRAQIGHGVVIINRPVPPMFCGPCPHPVTDHRQCTDCGHRPHLCATGLMAPRGAVEVVCPACKTTHNVEKLVNHLLARADEFKGTVPEVHRIMRMLGTPVSERTLYLWAKHGRIRPAGYLRADKKRIGVSRRDAEDKPVYRVADVRKQFELSNRKRRGRPIGKGK